MLCMSSTDSGTTNLADVKWTAYAINQRCLPPFLLMTLRITLPVHHHYAKHRDGTTHIFGVKAFEFQTAKVTMKVIQGH